MGRDLMVCSQARWCPGTKGGRRVEVQTARRLEKWLTGQRPQSSLI